MRIRCCAAALVGALVFLSPTRPVRAAEAKKAGGGPEDQRALCDAKCRQDYQGNTAAIDACIRTCGAADPASPGAKTTTVKSSKSNSSDRAIPAGVKDPTPAETTKVKSGKSNSSEKASNLNLSKSNVDREAVSSASGVVTSVDAAAKTISLRRKDGSIIVMDASKLAGGLPKIGQSVDVRYADVGGKPTAQSIAVSDPGAEGPKKPKK